MKTLRYLVLTAITILSINSNIHALTTTTLKSSTLVTEICADQTFESSIFVDQQKLSNSFAVSEIEQATVQSADFITRNLSLLYSICIVLVLINLIVQVKIVIQMVQLFFQFRKKDEFSGFKFNGI